MGLSLRSIVGAVAPVLAAALPGPLGGMAKKVIADALGVTDGDDAAIDKALASNNPEILVKLREAEQKFLLDMEAKGIDFERIAADDRASARAMQVATKSRAPGLIAIYVLSAWTAAMAAMIFKAMPLENKDVIMILIGALTASMTQIVQFFFGSSAGSRSKEEALRALKDK